MESYRWNWYRIKSVFPVLRHGCQMDIFTASFWFPDRVLCVIYTAFGIGVSTDNGKIGTLLAYVNRPYILGGS